MIPKTFVMYMGYVESSLSPCLVLRHRKGFKTVEEALKNLGAAFYDAAITEEGYLSHSKLRECCKDKTSCFCPECGAKLKPYNIDEEKLEQVIYRYMLLQAHESGEYWESLENYGWSHFIFESESNPFKNGYVVITECDSKIAQIYFRDLNFEGDDYIIIGKK